ncbi:MAG TPA: ATP-binding cassette domain-containing protein, partial [Stenotrophomonas sp.]
ALYAALRALSYRRLRDGNERKLISAARQQSHLLESIRGMQSIKVAGSSASRRAAYLNLMQETTNRDVWLWHNEVIFSAASHLVFGLERVGVIWLGALLAMENVFSVGMLIAYLSYKDQFAGRVSSLIDKGVELRMLRLHGERLGDIALAEPERDPEQGIALPEDTSLEVDGLGFRYNEGESWILKDCTFRVGRGESVAIVGASGCGKTTLMKVLLGLLEPQEGAIRVGGMDLQRMGAINFRRMVGVVMQDDQLFAGSISENIVFDDEGQDAARIEQAARLAAIHDEIVAMPMGYHTMIGDMGTSLSGGQKQRVILARALYRQPRLLFLDEATSHLDTQGEQLVNAAIRDLQLTRIIIAHRPETIASADRVLVMHQGRIVRTFDPRATDPASQEASP